jgi:hypothetical protein
MLARLLAAFLLVVFAAQPALAITEADITALARWAGCSADVVASERHSPLDSAYGPLEHTLYIGTAPDMDPGHMLIVLLHEIGHCLQRQDGFAGYASGVEIELDADRIAADLACDLGLNGPGLLRDLFLWVRAKYGYNGDPGHGTLHERIRQGERAKRCPQPAELQAA